MERTQPARRASVIRKVGWLGVASMLALALLVPSTAPTLAAPLSGAIYTSNFDGSIINANIYPSKDAVYLTGGPCNGGSHLEPGDYYFEVKSPSGVLLSSDAISKRRFTVGASEFIAAADPSHLTHAVNCTPAVVGITIQLMPYADTPNPGGEYKLTVATAVSVEACDGFSPSSTTFEICNRADQKTDNFKVVQTTTSTTSTSTTSTSTTGTSTTSTSTSTSSTTSTSTSTTTSSTTSSTTSTSTSSTTSTTSTPLTITTSTSSSTSGTQTVAAETGTPTATVPPTDSFGGPAQPSGEGWRMLLFAMAGLLAAALVLSPAPVKARR
jgi:hypothetical protein